MKEVLLMAALGSGFMLLMTSLGASVTLVTKKEMNPSLERFLVGFSGGVMLAASVWSMIIPSLDGDGKFFWLPAALGIFLGAGLIIAVDALLSRFALAGEGRENETKRRNALLWTAMTLHNIPEGMAVGLLFALSGGVDLAPATALAICIGIQNFPEGAALSLPLRKGGMSRGKAAMCGILSGTVEVPAALFSVLAASFFGGCLRWLLGFAAGAMIYVTLQELIPESHGDNKAGTVGALLGFVLMLVCDVAIG